jgi:hypothetical protein
VSARLKIGTWNLERSGARHRGRMAGQRACLAAHDCDIWVLTETHDDVQPPGHSHHLHCAQQLGWQQPGERLVSIWSRFPLTPVETACPGFTAAARLQPPGFPRPLLIYGTVITYAHDTAPINGGDRAPAWSRHRAAVAAQTLEWRQLLDRFAGHDLCVAGDFNMNLDGTRWYGVKDARAALLQGMADAGLHCWTTENFRVTRPGLGRASVDHIAFSDSPNLRARVDAWPGTDDGLTLSDHNGVAIEITLP